jgi:hypothetical protein
VGIIFPRNIFPYLIKKKKLIRAYVLFILFFDVDVVVTPNSLWPLVMQEKQGVLEVDAVEKGYSDNTTSDA